MSGNAEEREKKRFFDTLYDLDQEDDEGYDGKDQGRQESVAFLRRAEKPSRRPRTAPGLERVASELSRAGPSIHDLERVGDQHQLHAFGLKRSVSAPNPVVKPPMSSANTKGSKRKPSGGVRLAPEAQRIFKNLTFFFFPNSDVNVPRRQRIQKTVAYGATWSRDWSNDVTHVIVDKSFNYKQLLEYLKLDSLPKSVLVVDETYPSDCLAYRCMLDARQKSYQVRGYVEATAGTATVTGFIPGDGQQPAVPSQSSTTSLPLKPPTKGVMAREPQTPSRTDEESIERRIALDPKRPVSNHSDHQQEPAIYDDALEATIARAKAMQDVPLDLDEEEDDPQQTSIQDDSDAEASDAESQPAKRQKLAMQDKFRCMQKHDGTRTGENPNARTIEILEKMATYYDGTKDQWRTRAYRIAIGTLRKQTRWITSASEASLLPGIGARLAEKIEEIALTSELRRLDAVASDPKDEILQRFTKIYGVGIAQATKWVEQGFQTLDDLREKAKLTANQEVGLAHYGDFLGRIPRDEVTRLGDFVKMALRRIDPAFEVTIGGSYRRGSKDSGDIDLLITKPNARAPELCNVVLEQLVPHLIATSFLKCALAATSKDKGSKWHGACALPTPNAPWRRIDLLLVPWDEMGAALIYFTGNDIFNRSIRLLASTKGMRLNQRGLYKDVMRGKGRERITEGELVEGRSERRIFEFLGVPWRPPEHRIC